jgi:hypothetical protein
MFSIILKAQESIPELTTASESGLDLFYAVFSNYNYFVLAFTMFYSSILYMNFWFWRLWHHRDRLHHEAKGVKSIQDAWWMWARYLVSITLFTLAMSSANVYLRGFFVFIYTGFLFFQILNNGIVAVLNTLSQGFGQIGWSNDWPKTLISHINSLNYKTLSSNKTINLWYILTYLYLIFAVLSIITLTIWSVIAGK